MNCRQSTIIAMGLGLIAACASPHQEPDGIHLNASFEHATPNGYPVAWYIEADAEANSVAVDGSRSHQGQRSLHVAVSDGGPVILYTPLLLNGRCLKSLGAVARAQTGSRQVSVSLFFLAPGGELQSGDALIGPTREWQAIRAATTSGEECLPGDLMVGMMIQGQGEIWIDELNLSTDDPSYRLSRQQPREAGPGALETINELAVELSDTGSSESPGNPDELHSLFGNANIVGLGENSHGARHLFQLKASLVRYLIVQEGFDRFALEMPADHAAVVNDYVLGRSDDADAALLALSYPSWQTAEMWELLEWLRAHNRDARDPVTFHGLDTPRSSGDDRSDDQRMAERAQSLHAGSGGLIIWADNTHVTRAPSAMGGLLAGRHGDAYMAVGFTYNAGEYSAYGPNTPYRVHPGYPGTHEHLLARARPTRFLLDLDRLPEAHPLLDVRGWRYIGSRPQELHQFYPHRLRVHFDVIGYIERTSATRYLLEHKF